MHFTLLHYILNCNNTFIIILLFLLYFWSNKWNLVSIRVLNPELLNSSIHLENNTKKTIINLTQKKKNHNEMSIFIYPHLQDLDKREEVQTWHLFYEKPTPAQAHSVSDRPGSAPLSSASAVEQERAYLNTTLYIPPYNTLHYKPLSSA